MLPVEVQETVHDQREKNKLSLQLYRIDNDRAYDDAVDYLIKQKRDEIEKLYKSYNYWVDLEKDDPEKYTQIKKEAAVDSPDTDIDELRFDDIIEVYQQETQLLPLMEMKVIYAFKSFEIGLKKLLENVFVIKKPTQLFKWDVLKETLKDYDILLSEIEGYTEIDQLRNVNNVLKYAGIVDDSIKKIGEFNGLEVVDYDSLEKFYNRVRPFITSFFEALKGEIEKYLYDFTDLKIEKLSKNLVLRMGKDDANKLIKSLQNFSR